MTTAARALPPEQFQDQDPDFIVEKPISKAIFCVLFVGDTLTSLQKRAPRYKLGGKLFPRPDYLVVPNEIVRTCEITRLRKAMRSVHRDQIDPAKLEGYLDTYKVPNVWNPKTRQYETVEYGNTESTKYLVYKQILPAQQIGAIAHRGDGVIQVDAGIESAQDIKDAQLWYFPNWLDILKGVASLPTRMREIEDYIRTRQANALTESLRQVGDAFLYSIAQYRDWGVGYVGRQTDVIAEAKKAGSNARYDEISERLFVQLELTREDALVKDFARNNADAAAMQQQMADAMAMMAQSQQTITALMAQMATGGIQVSDATVQAQAPVPVTTEEAAAEFERAADDIDLVEGAEAEATEEAAAQTADDIEFSDYLKRAAADSEDEVVPDPAVMEDVV